MLTSRPYPRDTGSTTAGGPGDDVKYMDRDDGYPVAGVSVGLASDPEDVARQAGLVAEAWSPAGAPSSWRLTAAQFEALTNDRELAAIAATIPPDRLPPLLFTAAATLLVLELQPQPLRGWFPRVGEPQPPLEARFAASYRDFCLDHRERLLRLCARHRYQMNEVGRCAEVVPALAPIVAEGRDVALVDVGTGAGLGLQLDRYGYVYREGDGSRRAVGDAQAPLTIEVEVRGPVSPPLPPALPPIVDRVGIDIEPLDLAAPGVLAWLAACVPQEISAVTRFHRAAEIAGSHPARTVRGDACDLLPSLLEGIDAGRWCASWTPTRTCSSRRTSSSAFVRWWMRPALAETSIGSRSIRSCRWAKTRATACSDCPFRSGSWSGPAGKGCSA